MERTGYCNGGFVFDATGDGTADDVFVLNGHLFQVNEVLIHDGVGGWSRLESGPLVERTSSSAGGFVFDATGDGTADDVFVANSNNEANEVLVHDGVGGWSHLDSGPLVERTDCSHGGFVFDATGDGTADDIFVFNHNEANEVLVHDGVGGWSRLESGLLVERTDSSAGGFVFDATGDGTADDVFVANWQANEVLVHDGVGGWSRLESGPLVERTDCSYGGFVFDATGDGTADDVFVVNGNQANEVFVHDGAGGWSRRESGPLVERTDGSNGGFVFDATGDGTADDVFVVNGNQANEVLIHDGVGGWSRLESGPLVERTDSSHGGFVFDATGDGTADDVFVANGNQANEVLVNYGASGWSRLEIGMLVTRTDFSSDGFVFDATGDGTADDVFVANGLSLTTGRANEVLVRDGVGGWSRLESGPLVERTDNSYGGFVFDATGDGTADDVFVANDNQANEVLIHDGVGGWSRLESGPLVERTDNSRGGFVFDATGDGTADDIFVANANLVSNGLSSGQANEVLVHDGVGGWSRLESGPLVERTDSSHGGFVFDATGDGTA
eukprot:COSAG02_NODE_7420_length_3023_cov_12.110465_2_plen_557_part_01